MDAFLKILSRKLAPMASSPYYPLIKSRNKGKT
jgi:hypothetical protein